MKILVILMLTLSLIIFSCKRSATINIKGSVDTMENVIVRLTNNDYSVVYNSVIVNKGKFEMILEVPEKGFYKLDFASPELNRRSWAHSAVIYLEDKAKYRLKATGPSAFLQNYFTVESTSVEQQKLNEYNSALLAERQKLKIKRALYVRLADAALLRSDNLLYNALADTIRMVEAMAKEAAISTTHNFIQRRHNTIIVPYLISQASDLFENYTLYKSALDSLDTDVKNSKYYRQSLDLLTSVNNIYVGATAPKVYGEDMKGKNIDYNFKLNKLTLINFWASYCIPCREEVPQLKDIYSTYNTKGFDIVSVSIDENREVWARASSQDKVPWANISENVEQEDSRNIKNFVVKSIPLNYLVNQQGKFVARNVYPDSIEKILKRVCN